MVDIKIEQLSIVENIDDVDLRSLFDTSLTGMEDAIGFFPSELKTANSKFDFFRDKVLTILADPKCFAFKRTIDGIDVSFNIGTTLDTKFVNILGLVGKINDSKSWLYTDGLINQQMQFLINNNFTALILHSMKNSDAETHITERYSKIPGVKLSVIGQAGQTRNTLVEFPI
jgi:hypothetical protein